MKFKLGDKVVWISQTNRAYLLGEKAIVKGIDSVRIFVDWLPPTKQANGSYYNSCFKLYIKPGEQLLFPFMGRGIL